MKLNRSKNLARNAVFGVLSKVFNMFVPFVMRTVIIYLLGIKYVGLNGLFSSVLSVLNIAELGVGSALIFSMYEPLANDDTQKICALMRLYKIYYRIIGLVILALGIAITPFLPNLIKDDLPDGVNLYVLYYMNLLATVFSYWLYAYKICIINVHQRTDIVTKVYFITDIIKYATQCAVLALFKSYYAFLVVSIVIGILNNLIIAYIVNKKYPQYQAKGELPKDEIKSINQRVKDLFLIKIGGTILDSSDAIVISTFLGLTSLAIYQNYLSIFNAVFGFASIIAFSSIAGVGNSLVTESEEKNFRDMRKFTFFYFWLATFAVCCFGSIYQPFMKLWVGEKNLLPYGMVILFCIYFYIKLIKLVLEVYKDASGTWHQDRFRSLTTGLVNLAANLIMVHYIGIYGILISTILSIIFIDLPWLFNNLFTTVFHFSPKKYIFKIIKYILVMVLLFVCCTALTHFVVFNSLLLTVIVRLVICVVFPNSILFLIYRKSSEFESLINMVVSLTHGKANFLKKLANK